MANKISQDRISHGMVVKSIKFMEESLVLEIPTVVTYPEFVRSLLEQSTETEDHANHLVITDAMVERCLEYFENSLVLTIPTVVTYPEFMRDLLVYAILGEMPASNNLPVLSETDG